MSKHVACVTENLVSLSSHCGDVAQCVHTCVMLWHSCLLWMAMRGRPPFSCTCNDSHICVPLKWYVLPSGGKCRPHWFPLCPYMPAFHLPILSSYPSVPSVSYPRHTVSYPSKSHSSPYLGADRVTGRSRSVLLVRTQKNWDLIWKWPEKLPPTRTINCFNSSPSNFNPWIKASNMSLKIMQLLQVS